MIELLDEFKHGVHRPYMRIRAIIGTPFLVNGSCRKDARQVFFGNTNGGVGLTVLQQYVISWIILLDECIFQQ